VLADELLVLDADSSLWAAARPLLDVALRLEQNDEGYCWHGWHKKQISQFLKSLPAQCSLVLGVWEMTAEEGETHEALCLGIACEIVGGELCSIRTFEALAEAGLKPAKQLEPGIDDALEIMRVVRTTIAPAAWALFMDKVTWDEWLFAGACDKGELLAAFARQGRCVLLGSRSAHHH
jgi:hypothetical protein